MGLEGLRFRFLSLSPSPLGGYLGRGFAAMYAGRKVPGLGICKELDIWDESEICLGGEWFVVSFQRPAW